MANVIIKSDERKANTAAVLQAYGVRGNATASQREAAEHIAANALYQIEVDHVKSVTFDAEMVRNLLK